MNPIPAFITPRGELSTAPWVSTVFNLDRSLDRVVRAELAFSALGVVEPFLNGSAASPDVLSPGWSSYEWRLRVVRREVRHLLGDHNQLALRIGNGWYRGRVGWNGKSRLYGDRRAAMAQLTIHFTDGHVQTIDTSPQWSAGESDVVSDDLLDGQTIDARRRGSPDIAACGGIAASLPVDVVPVASERLTEYIGPGIVRHERLLPQRTWRSARGTTIVDFGQNIVGWVSLRARGAEGRTVTVHHAEILDQGELARGPLRSAKAEDVFILSGAIDHFEPTLTLHGFRYIEIDAGDAEMLGLEAVVVGSDLRRVGTFECSNTLLNQLHRNVVWSMRGNFVDVPTDCPQRDERLGWTGDISVFAPTAAYLYDVRDFLRDWLADLSAEQAAHDGIVPYVIPDAIKLFEGVDHGGAPIESTAIWGDAAVWVPWAVWEAYGDVRVLHAQFESIAAHVRRVASLLSPSGVWDAGFQFGDWLDPDAPADQPGQAKTPPAVVATLCAFRTATLAARIARVLRRPEEATEFDALSHRLRRGFHAAYVADGVIAGDAPTGYALALEFGILSTECDRRVAGERLVSLVRGAGHRIATGFAGTPFILDALTRAGYVTDAYSLLLQTGCPSWLYPVSMGATTVWERWDSLLPDGTVNPSGMTSFNHYALGSVAHWMHTTIGGIAPLEPGYRRILVAPRPGGGLTWAKAQLETPHGEVGVSWYLEGDQLVLDVQLPTGAAALLRVEGLPDMDLSEGVHHIAVDWPQKV